MIVEFMKLFICQALTSSDWVQMWGVSCAEDRTLQKRCARTQFPVPDLVRSFTLWGRLCFYWIALVIESMVVECVVLRACEAITPADRVLDERWSADVQADDQ